MDPSALAAPHPNLSRDEKRHLFEEQKQRRLEQYVARLRDKPVCLYKPYDPHPFPLPSSCDSFSAGAPFSNSGRMGEDVEQIQEKVRSKEAKDSILNAPMRPFIPASPTFRSMSSTCKEAPSATSRSQALKGILFGWSLKVSDSSASHILHSFLLLAGPPNHTARISRRLPPKGQEWPQGSATTSYLLAFLSTVLAAAVPAVPAVPAVEE